jgi:hypothetical protein
MVPFKRAAATSERGVGNGASVCQPEGVGEPVDERVGATGVGSVHDVAHPQSKSKTRAERNRYLMCIDFSSRSFTKFVSLLKQYQVSPYSK